MKNKAIPHSQREGVQNSRRNHRRQGQSWALSVLLAGLLSGLSGSVWAQENPSAPTPPTPLPKEIPATEPYGITAKDIQPVRVFEDRVPGQPLPSDPSVIRTLDEAVAVALARNPNILLTQERALRVEKQVRQILATNGPQISLNGTYTRLSGIGAAFGGGGGGISPGQIQNPFPVGLNNQPPGAIPVTLSSNNAGFGANQPNNAGVSAAGTPAPAAGTAVTGQTRSASRQTDGGGDGDGDGGGTPPPQQGGGGFGAGGIDLDQYNVRASITQLIDITGIVRTAVQVGRLEEALTRLELVRQRLEITLNVKNAFYNLLRAQAFVTVNEAAVAQSQELLRVTEAQQRAGVASEFDVLRARTQLENNRQALISSRNQVAIAKNALANIIGIDPSTPIQPEAPPEIPPMPTLDETRLITEAFANRPEYAQADINVLKAEKNVRLARRNLEPFLNVGLNGTYNPNPAIVADQRATGSANVTLTVPINDGGATRAAVDAARSDERSALIQKDQYVRGIKAEVQQAVIAVRDADERATATQQTVEQATEALRLANVRFRAGVGTQLDVNDAQTALVQAQTNAVNARYDYLNALAQLARAVGRENFAQGAVPAAPGTPPGTTNPTNPNATGNTAPQESQP
ncbi:MAG: TolC family protein [Armatimonadaceae bacterium]